MAKKRVANIWSGKLLHSIQFYKLSTHLLPNGRLRRLLRDDDNAGEEPQLEAGRQVEVHEELPLGPGPVRGEDDEHNALVAWAYDF